MATAKKERRRGVRIQPTFRVRTEVLQEDGEIHMAVFADILNLSEGGLALRSPLKLETNDRLIIFLPRLDNRLPLELHGRVIWTRSAGSYLHEYGMKFTGVPTRDKIRVRRELKAIMQSYFDQQSLHLGSS